MKKIAKHYSKYVPLVNAPAARERTPLVGVRAPRFGLRRLCDRRTVHMSWACREHLVGGGHFLDTDVARHVGVANTGRRSVAFLPRAAAPSSSASAAAAGPSLTLRDPRLQRSVLIRQRLDLFVESVGPRQQGRVPVPSGFRY